MATVLIQKRKRNKRNSYIVYYKDPHTGKRRYYKTFQRQREAQQASNDLRALLDSGKIPNKVKKRVRMLLFGEVAEEVKKDWSSRLKIGELRPKTVDEYFITLNSVNKIFSSRLLCEINAEEIRKYREEIAFKLSNISSNKRFAIIRRVFEKGLEMNAVLENPVKKFKFLSEKMHERNRFILPAGIEALVEASKQTKAKYYMPALIYLGAEHGASKQEALSLCWSDINFDYENIGIVRFYRTKNQNERTEYLMPRSRKALEDWKKHQKWMRGKKKVDAQSSDIVFSHLNGTQIQSFNRAWWATLKIAGIEDFHFHDLRHTFCSNLILSGAGLKEVKEMIGHSDISMTDRYSHLTINHKLLRQRQLAEHYETSDI